MSTDIQPQSFEYGDSEQRIVVEQRFTEAQSLMRQGLVSLIEAGGKFSEIRDLLRHNKRGGFDGWIDSKGLTRRTVYRTVEMHAAFATVPNMAQLDIVATAAYLLAAPSTPDEARTEALTRASAGEKIGVSTAKTIILEHKPIGAAADPQAFASPEQLQGAVRSWLGQFGGAVRKHILAQIALQNDVGRDRLLLLAEYAKRMGLRGLLGDLKKACAVVATETETDERETRNEKRETTAERDLFGGKAEGAGRETRCMICNRVLDDPESVARGYGPECADKVRSAVGQGQAGLAQGSGGRGQESGDAAAGLVATVEEWLAALVENAELADDADGKRTALYAVLHRRQNGGAKLWASLRKFAGNGAVVSAETQRELIEAVRGLLGETTDDGRRTTDDGRPTTDDRGNGGNGASGGELVSAPPAAHLPRVLPAKAEITESARLLGVLRRATVELEALRDGLVALVERQGDDGTLAGLVVQAQAVLDLLEAA